MELFRNSTPFNLGMFMSRKIMINASFTNQRCRFYWVLRLTCKI